MINSDRQITTTSSPLFTFFWPSDRREGTGRNHDQNGCSTKTAWCTDGYKENLLNYFYVNCSSGNMSLCVWVRCLCLGIIFPPALHTSITLWSKFMKSYLVAVNRLLPHCKK
jgi:hypothetical protein